tara:strand:+ start:1837 stop:2583 length:747 start_codon:yes stop_codon:yes gene_type:complete
MGIARNRGVDMGIRYQNKDNHMMSNQSSGPLRLDLLDAFDDLSAKDSSEVEQLYCATERVHHFDEVLFDKIPDGCDLTGYFQTEKYFKHCEDQVRREFRFNDHIQSEAMTNLREIPRGVPKVSIHVRRGDYTQLQDFHPLCTLEYYKNALSEVGNECYPVVFSDDIQWCKDNLGLEDAYYSEGNSQFVDMCMMSKCDSHIIANSSFSWWGAWLNKHPVMVVAPERWFGDRLSDKNTEDIYCEGWIKCS